jgi:uncharacterized protein (DUF1697 family)
VLFGDRAAGRIRFWSANGFLRVGSTRILDWLPSGAQGAAPVQRLGLGCVRATIVEVLMAVIVAMLRGVNVGGHNRVPMEELTKLCASLKLRGVQTYVQSGNVIFKTDEKDFVALAKRMERAIAKKFGVRTDVVLRSAAELREVVARNPFAERRGIVPGKLLVTFLGGDPGEEARVAVRAIRCAPDELFIDGREAYMYFPNGMGRPTLSWATIPKTLKVSGTGRNWNSVTKMLEMAEKLESAP